jgi:hypothetical protein
VRASGGNQVSQDIDEEYDDFFLGLKQEMTGNNTDFNALQIESQDTFGD